MQKDDSWQQQDNDSLRREAGTRLESLQLTDLRELSAFARNRLQRVGLSGDEADDMVQIAIGSVLIGMERSRQGRKPRLVDVESHAAFICYLKSAICSGVEALKRKESKIQKTVFAEDSVATHSRFLEEFIQKDFSKKFFDILKHCTPARLRPVVENWAEGWEDSEIIPIGRRHRRTRQELRTIATSIAKHLGT